MTFQTFLRLGRVSNLPTVGSNVLVALAFAGVPPTELLSPVTLFLFLGMSGFYIGGMFLNDFFDVEHDRRNGKKRPLVEGVVSVRTVGLWSMALLSSGFFFSGLALVLSGNGIFWESALSLAALFIVIFLYNLRHKENILSSLLMGLARFFVYVSAFLIAGGLWQNGFLAFAVWSFLYVSTLTWFARSEDPGKGTSFLSLLLIVILVAGALFFPGVIASPGLFLVSVLLLWLFFLIYRLRRDPTRYTGKTIMGLIAGIALLDGAFASLYYNWTGVVIFILLFFFTLTWQKKISGT